MNTSLSSNIAKNLARSRQPGLYGIESLVDRLFRDPWANMTPGDWVTQSSDWVPTMDVAETDSGVSIKLEVPGVDPEKLDIDLAGHTLTIKGEKSEESEEKGKGFYHSERRFGSFKRVVELPQSVNPESVSAEHKHGVVTISFKKNSNGSTKKIKLSPTQLA